MQNVMCWGSPAVILELDENRGVARVDHGDGVEREVIVGISSERLRRGDIVLVHAGVIISKLTRESILEQINFFREILGGEAEEADLVRVYQVVLELAERIGG